jgi:acyl carrier protein
MTELADEEQIRLAVRKTIGEVAPRRRDHVAPEHHLVDIGYHSLAAVELSVELQEQFGLPLIDAAELRQIETVRDAEDLVLGMLRQGHGTAEVQRVGE